MNVDALKLTLFSDRTQIFRLSESGEVLYSCQTMFDLKSLGMPFLHHPVFQEAFNRIGNRRNETSFHLQARHTTFADKTGWFDLICLPAAKDDEEDWIFLLYDLTREYGFSPPDSLPPPPGNGLRILLIEDSLFNQRLTTTILEKEGYAVEIAEDGEQAIKSLERSTFDLLVTDLLLPGINGQEVIRTLQKQNDHPNQSVPAIALTAARDLTKLTPEDKALFVHILKKPVAPAQLLPAIRSIVSGKSPSKERMVHLDYLHEVAGNNKALISELIQIFLTKAPQMLQEMEAQLDAGEMNRLKETAHQTRANCRYMGIQALEKTAGKIEELAEQGHENQEIASLLARMKTGFSAAKAELEALKNQSL